MGGVPCGFESNKIIASRIGERGGGWAGEKNGQATLQRTEWELYDRRTPEPSNFSDGSKTFLTPFFIDWLRNLARQTYLSGRWLK
jgi:hypothetical protein